MTQSSAGGPPPAQSGPKKPGLVLAFLSIAQFMVFLDVTIVNVALPTIQRGLHIAQADLPYVVTAYGTLLGGCLLFGSRLADRFGRRRLFQIGLLVFGLASFAGGVSQGAIMLFIARGCQGFGAALVAPAALSTLTVTFSEGEARNKALGVWGALAGIASVIGVVVGGLLTQGAGWRWVFFINVPITIAAALFTSAVLPESRGERKRFDIPGTILLTGGLMLLIYSLDEAVTYSWGSARVLPGLIVAAVLLLAFIVNQRTSRDPLVPFSIFRLRSLSAANLGAMLLLTAVTGMFYFASLFMQQVLGYDPIKTGLAYLPLAVIVAVAAGIASQLVTKIGVKPVLAVGALLGAVALFLLWRVSPTTSYAGGLLAPFLIAGVGMGFSFVPLQIAAQIGVEQRQAGLAAGLINTSQELGGAFGLAIAATIALNSLPGKIAADHGNALALRNTLAGAYHHAFLVGSCFFLATFLVALLLMPMLKAAPQAGQEDPSAEPSTVNAG